jgi:hypothetical protein
MSISFFVNSRGTYMTQCDTAYGLEQEWVEVPSCPEDSRQTWDFESGTWSEAPKYVPPEIGALAGLLTLDDAGLSAAYKAWASSPDRSFVEDAFISKAMTWKREDPTILAAAEALGLSSDQVDDLFIAAAAR